jgi:phosphatidylinositol-4-phosphate 3-kinase
LAAVAENVKISKDSLRLSVLNQGLENLHLTLKEAPTCLPLKPSLEVAGIHIRTCSYYHSNTLPLKLNFLSMEEDGALIPAIFKVIIQLRISCEYLKKKYEYI